MLTVFWNTTDRSVSDDLPNGSLLHAVYFIDHGLTPIAKFLDLHVAAGQEEMVIFGIDNSPMCKPTVATRKIMFM
jgi:hypothetical protein